MVSLDLATMDFFEVEKCERTFEMHVTKPGTLHALGSWFDVFFDRPQSGRKWAKEDEKDAKVNETKQKSAEKETAVGKKTHRESGNTAKADGKSNESKLATGKKEGGGAQDSFVFSTAPTEPTTHWRQAIFYLRNPPLVETGDRILVELLLTRNYDFRRHFRVRLKVSVTRGGKVTHACDHMYYMWR